MVWKATRLIPLFALCSCSTLNQSLELGSSLGAASGALAIYAAHSAAGQRLPGGAIPLSAGIGLTVGALTAYLVHRQVETDRAECDVEQTEMHFGDLPPSPFIVPKMLKKGGAR